MTRANDPGANEPKFMADIKGNKRPRETTQHSSDPPRLAHNKRNVTLPAHNFAVSHVIWKIDCDNLNHAIRLLPVGAPL
jgi:hypothetical protein